MDLDSEPEIALCCPVDSPLRTAKRITGGFSHPSPCPLPVGRLLKKSLGPTTCCGLIGRQPQAVVCHSDFFSSLVGERVQRTVIPFAVLCSVSRNLCDAAVSDVLPSDIHSMFIINRYLLRQFLQTFVICFISITGLFIVFDAFTNLESFLRGADKHGGLARLLASHYAFQSLTFFDLAAGYLTLMAAMFTAAWIQRHNELTALMAAGISRVRVIAPVIGAVVAVLLLAAVNRELVMPRFCNELARTPQDYAGDMRQNVTPQLDDATNILIRGKACYADDQRIEKPTFRLPQSFDRFPKQITAAKAFYRPAAGSRPAGYLLEGVDQAKEIGNQPSLLLEQKPLILTHRDQPSLEPDQCFIASTVPFEELTNRHGSRSFNSTRQLIAILRNSPDSAGKLRVMIHGRIVQPLLDITLLFLGLPIIISRGNRNVFMAMGLCGIIVVVFSLVVMGFRYMGENYAWINPMLAAWIPLMLFVPLAVETGLKMSE